MRQKLLYILCFLMFFIWGCEMKNGTSESKKPYAVRLQAVTAIRDLAIADSHTTMYPGETGYIIVQGRPGVRYTINTSFRKDNVTNQVRIWRTAGRDGRATFTWNVSPDTAPGTYSGTISGGGDTVNFSHTVLALPDHR